MLCCSGGIGGVNNLRVTLNSPLAVTTVLAVPAASSGGSSGFDMVVPVVIK